MTKSTIDLNNNCERQDSSIGDKNLQFIEQIGKGRISTGNFEILFK